MAESARNDPVSEAESQSDAGGVDGQASRGEANVGDNAAHASQQRISISRDLFMEALARPDVQATLADARRTYLASRPD